MADGPEPVDLRSGSGTRRVSRSTLILLGGAAVGFATMCAVVQHDHVARWELDVTTWVSGAPNGLVTAVWPVMQLGSLWSAILIGTISIFVYGRRRSIAVLASGLSAWYLANLVKEIVGRGRPIQFLPGVTIHDKGASGNGFVSGHAAVAFAIATALLPVLPRRGRIAAYALASVVGITRVVNGVHLPLDVVGGACLGIVCGCVTEIVLVGRG